MITITHQPDELSMVRNPIAYKLTTDEAPGTYIGIELHVETFAQSGVYEKKYEAELQVDADLAATFYLHEVLRRNLDYDLPAMDVNITGTKKTTQMCKRWYLRHREIVDNVAGSWTDEAPKYAFLGGFNWYNFPGRATSTPGGRVILTARPLARKLTSTQKEFLYYLPAADATDFTLTILITFTDGTTQSANEEFLGINLKKFQPVIFYVGNADGGWDTYNPAKVVQKVEITATNKITLIPWDPKVSYAREFYYFSPTLGGMETLVTSGKGQQQDSFDRVINQRYVAYDYSVNDAEFQQDDLITRQRFQQSIGLRTQAELAAYQEFLSSERQYLRIGNNLVQINVLNSEISYPADRENLYTYTFEYQFAHIFTGIL